MNTEKTAQEQTEKSRLARLLEVRRQERRFASKTRGKFQERLNMERNFVASHLKTLWMKERESEEKELHKKHEESLTKLGQSHQLAVHANLEDMDMFRTKKLVKDREKAEVRHRRALSEAKQQRKEDKERERVAAGIRNAVKRKERQRAASVAAKSPPPSEEFILNLAIDEGQHVYLKNVEGYTSTHCHLPAGAVYKEKPDTQVDARKAAIKLEEERKRLQRETTRELLERNEKAWLRHKQAWNEVKLKQDCDALLGELDGLEKAGRLQRKNIAIERAKKRVRKSLDKPTIESKEKQLETAIERIIFDAAEMSGGSAPVTESEVSEDDSLCPSVHVPGAQEMTSSSCTQLEEDQPDPLQLLLERVRAQRTALAEEINLEPFSKDVQKLPGEREVSLLSSDVDRMATPNQSLCEGERDETFRSGGVDTARSPRNQSEIDGANASAHFSPSVGEEEVKPAQMTEDQSDHIEEEALHPMSPASASVPLPPFRLPSSSHSPTPALSHASSSTNQSKTQHDFLLKFQERLASQRQLYNTQKDSIRSSQAKFSALSPPTKRQDSQPPFSLPISTSTTAFVPENPPVLLKQNFASLSSLSKGTESSSSSSFTESRISTSNKDESSLSSQSGISVEKTVFAVAQSMAETHLTVQYQPVPENIPKQFLIPRPMENIDGFQSQLPSFFTPLPDRRLLSSPSEGMMDLYSVEELDLSASSHEEDPTYSKFRNISLSDDLSELRLESSANSMPPPPSPVSVVSVCSSLIDLSVALREPGDGGELADFFDDLDEGDISLDFDLSSPSRVSMPWHVLLKSASKEKSVASGSELGDGVEADSGLTAESLSLQEAFAKVKRKFIAESHDRREKIAERAKERGVRLEEGRQADKACGVRQVRSTPVAVVDSKDRKIKKQEMLERNKRFYERLPEVKQRRAEEQRKAGYAENRKKAKEFNKRLQRPAKRPATQITSKT